VSYTKGGNQVTLPADGTFTLTNGESITIKDLPVGTKYTVTETADNDYDTTYSLDGAATVSALATGEKVLNDADIIAYTNSYKQGSLTITKTGLEEGDSAIFLIKKGDAEYQKVVVTGDGDKNDSVTIKLPKGSYNVTETDWSWRYNGSVNKDITIAGGDSHNVTCANTLSDKYLNDEGIKVNDFN